MGDMPLSGHSAVRSGSFQMTTSQSVAVLRFPAVWFALGGVILALFAFSLVLRSGTTHGPGVAQYAAAFVAAGAAAGLLALGATQTIKRLIGLRHPPPTKLETADGVRCFVLHKQSLLIGRSECCDIVLPFKRVSTHHCHLCRAGNRWYIEDLHSLNGTAVNHRRVIRKRVRAGDVLQVADRELVFR